MLESLESLLDSLLDSLLESLLDSLLDDGLLDELDSELLLLLDEDSHEHAQPRLTAIRGRHSPLSIPAIT